MTYVQKIHKKYSKTRALQYLRICRKLLKNYMGNGKLKTCPLCEIGKDCSKCPWFLFMGEQCEVYVDEKFPSDWTEALRNRSNPRWTNLRIRQLKNWIGHFEKALETWPKKEEK